MMNRIFSLFLILLAFIPSIFAVNLRALLSTTIGACTYGGYGDYGYCINGLKTKSRPLLSGDPVVCLDLSRSQPCVNCQLTPWFDVGTCTNFQQLQKRSKITEPVKGGAKCSDVRQRLINCGSLPLINSYIIGEGPFWFTNPPALTCLEACATNFGGLATDYRCSISPNIITNTGYYDLTQSDFDNSYVDCPMYVSDATKSCETENCKVIAYVNYHNGCVGRVNYCWKA